MRYRLALLFAIIVVLAPGLAQARARRHKVPADAPTLFVSKEVMAIRSGRQKLTVRLADGVLQLETPYGNHDLTVNIASPKGWVHPTQVIAPPKTYRATDLVTAVVTFAVPDDRKMVLRISAYPGVAAVFVKSGVTGQFGAARDYYFWSWDGAVDSYFAPGKTGPEERKTSAATTRFDRGDWIFFPDMTGGLAVLTNGIVGYQPNQPFINALPRSRFLRPGETLDVGFGLAGVAGAADAAALSNAARAKYVATLKPVSLTKQTRIDYGAPAPDWLRNADMCRGWHGDWTDDMIGMWVSMSSPAIDVPVQKSVIEKVHNAGARAIVRVDCTQLNSFGNQTPDEADSSGLLDLSKHPDWVCIDSQGNPSESGRGLLNTCLRQPDLRDAVLTYVCNIMNLGADGILLDAVPISECYGPKFGKHTHPNPDASNNDEFENLSRQIFKLVKSLGDDKIVIQNSGIAPSRWSYCDAQMWEGFRFEGASEPVNEWSELQYAAQEHADAVRHGKVPIVLPHLSAVSADRRSACLLYIYSYTRLYGWLIDDWLEPTASPESQKLAAVRLGKPQGEVQRTGDVLYRAFEKGVVALNPTRVAVSAHIPTSRSGELTDVAYDRKLSASAGAIKIGMSPESGRVLLWAE